MDMGWTGHYVRMDAGKLANRAEVGKHQGCMSTEQAGLKEREDVDRKVIKERNKQADL